MPPETPMPPETEANVAEMVDAVMSDEFPPPDDSQADAPPGVAGPETEPSHEARQLEEIVECNREVTRFRLDHERKHLAAKIAKVAFEGAQDELNYFIKGLDEEYPLFDRKAQDAPPTGVVSDPSEGDQSWRSAPILELGGHGLAPAVLMKLAEDGIGTMGTLADHTNSGKLLTDIPGVGPSKAEAIEKALEGFWAARRTPTDAMLQAYCEGVEAKRAADAAADKPLSAYPDQPDAGTHRPPAETPKRRKKGGAA